MPLPRRPPSPPPPPPPPPRSAEQEQPLSCHRTGCPSGAAARLARSPPRTNSGTWTKRRAVARSKRRSRPQRHRRPLRPPPHQHRAGPPPRRRRRRHPPLLLLRRRRRRLPLRRPPPRPPRSPHLLRLPPPLTPRRSLAPGLRRASHATSTARQTSKRRRKRRWRTSTRCVAAPLSPHTRRHTHAAHICPTHAARAVRPRRMPSTSATCGHSPSLTPRGCDARCRSLRSGS